MLLAMLLNPISSSSATTRHLESILALNRTATCSQPYGCFYSYKGPILGPNLVGKTFTLVECLRYCTGTWDIGKAGGPDWLHGDAYGPSTPFADFELIVSNGDGIFEGATGTGTITCVWGPKQLNAVTPYRSACHLAFDIVIP